MPSNLLKPTWFSTDSHTRIPSRSPHPYRRRRDPSVPSSTLHTPSLSDAEDESSPLPSHTPSDSDFEADGDHHSFHKALPAPSLRPRKGLLGGDDADISHPITPIASPRPLRTGQSIGAEQDYFAHHDELFDEQHELAQERWAKYRRLRTAELTRRASEIVMFQLVAFIVVRRLTLTPALQHALWTHFAVVSGLCAAYLLHLSGSLSFAYPYLRLHSIHIPASFDPAPLLYPAFLPVLVALSLSQTFPDAMIPNLVLSLAALPSNLVPFQSMNTARQSLHWALSLAPVAAFSRLQFEDTSPAVPPETISMLYPLHLALLQPLQYITTTSLLTAELQLLSICLINLLLLPQSPQTLILCAALWIGGLSIFITCGHVLHWNIALERIPRWRFQRAIKVVNARNNFIASLLGHLPSPNAHDGTESSECAVVDQPRSPTRDRGSGNGSMAQLNGHSRGPQTPVSPTLSNRKRSSSSTVQRYLQFTASQASARKWMYAAYTYVVIVALLVAVILPFVSKWGLDGHESLGWALGYLLGQIPTARLWVYRFGLEDWIVLPTAVTIPEHHAYTGWVEHIRHDIVGEANVRLGLFAYWLVIVLGGIASVVRLSAVVEVDTRRKVFHGMMVAMLLPTTFIDPTYLGLGLCLVLIVFLLLDLFRAAQLRPLSQPLAQFLTPYVDGRDLRGPVVISHMFLLIGCAIPLWLSLAGRPRGGLAPWNGWEVDGRDVSMIAGVVCVGMGDAAASLIGRRYGRRKWPWAGGKSLEGSAAFAAAVTVGLLAAQLWLRLGGWIPIKSSDWSHIIGSASTMIAKTVVAAGGASFTEAVLTGCNDNVVVPIVLWLLVRGLGL